MDAVCARNSVSRCDMGFGVGLVVRNERIMRAVVDRRQWLCILNDCVRKRASEKRQTHEEVLRIRPVRKRKLVANSQNADSRRRHHDVKW